MDKKAFYKSFIGTETQVLKTGGVIARPSKISRKASIIIEALAQASIGWDYTLTQIQELVWQDRDFLANKDRKDPKSLWDTCGTFDGKDLVTVKDFKEAMASVYYNCRQSAMWDGAMLSMVALKNGEIVIRKVPHIEGFFKEPSKKEPSLKGTAEKLEALLKEASSEEASILKEALEKLQGLKLKAIA